MKTFILFASIAAKVFVFEKNNPHKKSKMKNKIGMTILLIALMIMPGFAFVENGICAENLIVNSNAVDGVVFVAPETGPYRFTITGGAYTNWSLDDLSRPLLAWYAGVLIYKKRPIEWTADAYNPNAYLATNADYVLGNITIPYATYEEAEDEVQGEQIDIKLNKGDYVILITPDGKCGVVDDPNDKCGYGDNTGDMYLDVDFIRCNFDSEPNIEKCFGGIGNQCKGDAPLLSFDKDPNTCFVHGWMSAGSILHDYCCVNSGNTGFHCASPKTNECRNEWALAKADVLCSRYWSETFGPYPIGKTDGDPITLLSVPRGEPVHPKFEYMCESGKCVTNKKGKTIIHGYPPCRYCICE